MAINPTKSEWNAQFPRGAAGVLLTDGRIVVGDGNMLAHNVILDYAKVDQNLEKYRLQICRNIAWVELWINDEAVEAMNNPPTEQEVREAAFKQYGETLEQIQAQLQKAVAPFMGQVEVRAVPLDYIDQEPLIERDKAFIKSCITA